MHESRDHRFGCAPCVSVWSALSVLAWLLFMWQSALCPVRCLVQLHIDHCMFSDSNFISQQHLNSSFPTLFVCTRETEPAAVWSSRAQTKESLCGCCSEVLCQTRSAKLLLAFGHVLQVLRSLCHVVSCPATSFLRDILSPPLIDRPVRLRIYAQSPLLRHKRQIIMPINAY